MPAPLAKGIIIAASILVAAGIAIYESPQFRAWVDNSRRKIAFALHTLGDDIHPHPRRPSESHSSYEERKRREQDERSRRREELRMELVRRERNELVRKAREEGVAVDLDELARIGEVEQEIVRSNEHKGVRRTGSGRSFDDMVGQDGMLRKEEVNTTGVQVQDGSARKRGATGFAAGAAAAAAISNPFDDDMILFDRNAHTDAQDEAPLPQPCSYIVPIITSRESSATVEAATPAPAHETELIDLTPESSPISTLPTQPAAEAQADTETEQDQSASFYSFTSSHPSESSAITIDAEPDSDNEAFSAGTLTPRSTRSESQMSFASLGNADVDSNASVADSWSEAGYISEAGYVSEAHSEMAAGVMTPNSWTDVGSDEESEWGAATTQGNGNVSL